MPIITAAEFFFCLFAVVVFSEIRLDISCESSAMHIIHMKCQALFHQKNNKKILSATIFLGTFLVTTHKI